MSSLLYFAYGSNMSTPRLAARVPSARPLCIARLDRHRLMFHKISRDGSAKCDIHFTDDPADSVYGVVFKIRAAEKTRLDEKEGLGIGYAEKSTSVINRAGESLRAFTYYATDIDAALKPYHWYKEHVLRGAKEHGLPSAYIRSIEAVESMADPSPRNHRTELSIYRAPDN